MQLCTLFPYLEMTEIHEKIQEKTQIFLVYHAILLIEKFKSIVIAKIYMIPIF